ncbi:restriction endonuclease subunit S domain-containing protein [Neorhizobium galegae]|nr:restriction endonuclease subunit S [Neorhizobium galegae]
MRENNLLSLSYGRIIRKDIDSAEGLLPESFETYQIVEPGNIVMRLTDLQNDKRSLRQGLVMQRGIITSAYDALEVDKDSDPRFWAYALLALDLAKYYYSLGGGVRQSVKFSDFPNEWLATPDAQTQKSIADFLDRETARIDQLIEKKQRLVVLVDEKRAVETDKMLFGRVDEGLMQASKLKFLAKTISKGTTPSTLGAEMASEGVRFLRAENIWFGIVTDSPQHFISDETHQIMARSALEENDVLVVIAGATTGKSAVIRKVQIPANTNQAISFIRLWKPYLAPIVSVAIQTRRVQQEIRLTSVQSAQPNLAMEDLGNLTVPAPEKNEAIKIISELELSDKKYRTLTDRVSNSINRLRELRSGLITAAVTGQVDVATWGQKGRADRCLDQIEEAFA